MMMMFWCDDVLMFRCFDVLMDWRIDIWRQKYREIKRFPQNRRVSLALLFQSCIHGLSFIWITFVPYMFVRTAMRKHARTSNPGYSKEVQQVLNYHNYTYWKYHKVRLQLGPLESLELFARGYCHHMGHHSINFKRNVSNTFLWGSFLSTYCHGFQQPSSQKTRNDRTTTAIPYSKRGPSEKNGYLHSPNTKYCKTLFNLLVLNVGNGWDWGLLGWWHY